MGSGKRVLLVEDNDDVRDAIADRLKHSGFVVFEARDGFRALSEMRMRHFHVVITDFQMPHLDGFGFLRQCREEWPSTPVIILSAASTSTEEFRVAGAYACIEKPFDADRLVALVCRAAGLPPPAAIPPAG